MWVVSALMTADLMVDMRVAWKVVRTVSGWDTRRAALMAAKRGVLKVGDLASS